MFKEKIKLHSGEEKEVEVVLPGFRLVKQIRRKHILVNKIKMANKTDIESMEGNFDFEGISEDVCIACIKGLSESEWEQVDALSVDDIYNKHFKRYFDPSPGEVEHRKK